MANNDKIYESYIGKRGRESQDNTQKRIEWILDNVGIDKNILDIGCSQGIISILIAQQGNLVKGIDIEEEAVSFAKELLEKEYKDLKEKVSFISGDFFKYNEDEKYDVIIITEVIEHLINPVDFIKHTKKYLKDNGKVIISVPFGINNHPDHKQTYYLTNIVDVVETTYEIEEIKYMTNWIGIIAKNTNNIKNIIYDRDIVRNLENNFLSIDKQLNLKNSMLYNNNMNANDKYRQSTQQYKILKEKYITCTTNNKRLNDMVQKLINDFEDEKEILRNNKILINRLQTQNSYLKQENSEYKRKLQLITDTYIGKMLLKVYRKLKKIGK